MWSLGTAVLAEVTLCIVVIALATRRLVAEIEPTRQSCHRLHHEVADAVRLVSRDTGRATAGRQLLAASRQHAGAPVASKSAPAKGSR